MKSKIALIYDRANTAYGGAEQVLLALKRLYPDLVLFTSVYDAKKAKWAKDFILKTSFLQKFPFAKKIHRYLAALMPFAFECLDLSSYDIIISVTSAEAKGVVTRRDQLHLCYLLSPPRYLYHYHDQYLEKNQLLKLPIISNLTGIALNYLKKWDQIAIYRPDVIIPIAEVVKKRAKKYYKNLQIEKVIYPPIDSTLLNYKTQKKGQIEDKYFLLVSRLVPYKNIAPAILACQKLGHKLIIVGEGPEENSLKEMANKLITFQKKISNEKLANLYQNCQAVLSPGLDDFGIAALEANLFGKPIIINQLSGAAELIEDNVHGIHLTYQEGDSTEEITDNLIKSIKKLEKSNFDPRILSKNALKYDTNRFVFNFDSALKTAYKAKKEGRL
jgi:glycosyltransferase involved in cell wall biosynthesis